MALYLNNKRIRIPKTGENGSFGARKVNLPKYRTKEVLQGLKLCVINKGSDRTFFTINDKSVSINISEADKSINYKDYFKISEYYSKNGVINTYICKAVVNNGICYLNSWCETRGQSFRTYHEYLPFRSDLKDDVFSRNLTEIDVIVELYQEENYKVLKFYIPLYINDQQIKLVIDNSINDQPRNEPRYLVQTEYFFSAGQEMEVVDPTSSGSSSNTSELLLFDINNIIKHNIEHPRTEVPKDACFVIWSKIHT